MLVRQSRSQHVKEHDVLDAKLRQDIALLQNALAANRSQSPGRSAAARTPNRARTPGGRRKLTPARVEPRGRRQMPQQKHGSPGSGRLRGRLAMDPWRSSQALVPPDLPTPKDSMLLGPHLRAEVGVETSFVGDMDLPALGGAGAGGGGLPDQAASDMDIMMTLLEGPMPGDQNCTISGPPRPPPLDTELLMAPADDHYPASLPPPLDILPPQLQCEVGDCPPLDLQYEPLSTSIFKDLRPSQALAWQGEGQTQNEDLERQLEEKRAIAEQMDDLLVGRISEERANLKLRERAKAKDQRIRFMEAELEKERERARREQERLQGNVQRLETELVVVNRDLYHAKNMPGLPEPLETLRWRLRQAEERNMQLTHKIRSLTADAFKTTTNLQEVMSEKDVPAMEEELRRKDEECSRFSADLQRALWEMEETKKAKASLESEYRWLIQEIVGMQEQYKAKRSRIQHAVEQTEKPMKHEDRDAHNLSKFLLMPIPMSVAAPLVAPLAGPGVASLPPAPPAGAAGPGAFGGAPQPPLGVVQYSPGAPVPSSGSTAAVVAAATAAGLAPPPQGVSTPPVPPPHQPMQPSGPSSMEAAAAAGSVEKAQRTALEIDTERNQKDLLAQELIGLKQSVQRNRDMAPEQKTQHLRNMDEVTLQLQQARSDCTKNMALASEREAQIKVFQHELQRKTDAIARLAHLGEQANTAAFSDASGSEVCIPLA